MLMSCLCQPVHAGLEGFIDRDDGHLDVSEWLVDRKGFLAMPIVVTEPAVGYGAGVALMFVRNSMRESAASDKGSGLSVPPDIWVVGAAATENGTRAAFGGGMMSFDEGRWKYRGGIGRADVKLDFYGVGGNLLGGSVNSIGYALDGWVSSQQMLRRIGDSDNWFGLRWNFLDLNSEVDLRNNPDAGLQPGQTTRRTSGLGLTLEHDSRDNIFTPSSGWTAALDATFYDPDWGSDTSFQSYRAHVFAYWPAAKTLVVAGRLDGRKASGRTPFYMLPFIEMRGIPAGRYQDQNAAVAETELRWTLTPRWAAVAFVGGGRIWGSSENFSGSSTVVSKGVGLRYLTARRLGLWTGLDYARGPEDSTVYLQVGNAWR